MTSEIRTALLSIFASCLTLAISYWLTKRREQDAEWKKEKLLYYKAFVESLSDSLVGLNSESGAWKNAKASNNLLLFASAEVIQALNEYKMRPTNCPLAEENALLKNLIIAIRKDVGFTSNDGLSSVEIGLWAPRLQQNAKL